MPSDDIVSMPYFIQGIYVLYPGHGITHNKPSMWWPEKFPEFVDCQTREETFTIEQNLILFHDVACLADAGFYYCGTGNKVQCFHCGLGLQDLDREDPLVMHVQLSPYCNYIHQTRDDDVIAAIQVLSYSSCVCKGRICRDRRSTFGRVRCGLHTHNKVCKITSQFFVEGNNETPEHVKGDVFVSIKHYLGEEANVQRRKSFQLPQTSANNVISELVDNGYFFCEVEQKACCAFCNKIVDLQPGTTPIIRHEAWCVYGDNKADGGR